MNCRQPKLLPSQSPSPQEVMPSAQPFPWATAMTARWRARNLATVSLGDADSAKNRVRISTAVLPGRPIPGAFSEAAPDMSGQDRRGRAANPVAVSSLVLGRPYPGVEP